MGLPSPHRLFAGNSRRRNNPYPDGTRHSRINGHLTESQASLVVGSSRLYEIDGQRRHVPMPTPDPADPLNLPQWRKWAAVIALCFYGGLTASAESIIGALLPVFMLEYAGIDPKGLGTGEIEFGGIGDIEGGPPTWKTALLSTMPLLMNGIVAFFFVPLSIAVGRRPVLLACGALSWSGGIWAALSTSLDSHIAARCFQAIGGGTIDSLLPLIVQDFMFIHERNKAVAAINASTGLIIVALGIGSPLIVLRYSWRWVYGLTSIVSFATWIAIMFLVPETRRIRSHDELAGKVVYPLHPGETRPRLDHQRYGYRTPWVEFGVFNFGLEWKLAAKSILQAIRTLFFPNVLWIICLNATVTGAYSGVQQLATSVLIGNGWKFEQLGLFVVPIVIASPFVWIFGGFIADKVSNSISKRRNGHREPEVVLVNMFFPILTGFAGCLVFGWTSEAAEAGLMAPWVVLVGVLLMAFTSSTIQSLVVVYVVESYPMYAGPALVCSSTFRLVVGFLWTFNVSTWVEEMGYFKAFSIYAGAIMGIALLLPVIMLYGKRIRNWSAGRIDPTARRQDSVDSTSSGGSKGAEKPAVQYEEFASVRSESRPTSDGIAMDDLEITPTRIAAPGRAI